jgi:hypothetical protein
MVMTTEKKHDPKVQELMNIYQDTAEDDKPLRNFITMRSLCYLRDITVAYYVCFGKEGIMSDNYKRAIDGLVGYGTTREGKSGEVKMNHVGPEYFTNMQLAVNEIEKMKNDSLPKYENFFKEIIKTEIEDAEGKKTKELKKQFSHEEINAINNKFEELKRDKGLKNIERPIDPDMMIMVRNLIKHTCRYSFPERIATSENITSIIPTEKMASYAVNWNSIVDLVVNIESIISDSKYGYGENVSENYTVVTKSLRVIGFKLRSIRRIMVGEIGTGADKLIPELKAITISKD